MGNFKPVILWLLLGAVYFVAAKLGLSLAFEQANTSPVWPPTGVAIAALLYFGRGAWPGVMLGAFIVNFSTGLPVAAAISVGIGNTLEAVVAAYLILRFANAYPFNSVNHVSKFVGTVFLATMVSATVGVTSLAVFNIISWDAFALLWLTWWLGDVVGGLVVAPFLLTWIRPFSVTWTSYQLLEIVFLSFLTLIFAVAVFSNWLILGQENYPIAFIYLPIAIWVAYRFHQYGATLFLVVISALAIYGTLLGYGPFVHESANESLLLLQGFVGVTMITSLTISASISESLKSYDELKEVRNQLGRAVAKQMTDLETAAGEINLAESVFNENFQSIMITNQDGAIIRVNPAFTRITGYTSTEVIGQNPKILKSNRHDKQFYDEYWAALVNEGSWQGEIWNRRKNGEIFPTWQTVSAVHNRNGEVVQYISIFSDISEKKVTEERIYHLAHYDIVTGLRNRVAFHDQLANAIVHAGRQQQQFALLYLDLDNFKLINDASGHPFGDMLLKHVAMRIKAVIREEDLIARLGGDEFVILLTDIKTSQDAALVAEKVLDEMARPVILENNEIVVTGSMGISTYPVDGMDADTLLKHADVAMFRAKDKGRNSFQFFTAEMNAQAEERLLLESDMRKGLQNDEFLLHYQPKVNVESGEITGCEALVRWQHPKRGMIPPNVFIPVAEETGLIRQLGEWVMRTACAQQKSWQLSNLADIAVAVNISGRQFISQRLIAEVQRIIEETDIDAKYLELELTESIIMENVEENIEILEQLHDMGVKLSIDDFGTGYSSMAYLKRFPIDKLKIDQSFVRDIATDPDDAAIVNATTALGHNLHMEVIAEGVETKQQLQFLKDSGCDEIQGYFFSRPLPADEFEELLKQRRNLHDVG